MFELEKTENMGKDEKLIYIKSKIKNLYNMEREKIDHRVKEYDREWNNIGGEIIKALEEIFGFHGQEVFGKFLVQVGLNPICPRYLEEYKFDCYYKLKSEKALENMVHELTHFFWFENWKRVFKDYDPSSFEYPHIIWIFSEIAIHPILRDRRLKKYCKLEKPAYGCFYNIEIGGENLLDYMERLYGESTLGDFMVKGLEFCEANKEILEKSI